MATLDDAARLAAELPGVSEGEHRRARAWSVGGRVLRNAIVDGWLAVASPAEVEAYLARHRVR